MGETRESVFVPDLDPTSALFTMSMVARIQKRKIIIVTYL